MAGKELGESQKALRGLTIAMLIGVLSVLLYALHSGGLSGWLTRLSVGVLLGGAALLVGGILGFLFGIPRTLQQDDGGAPDGTNANINNNSRRIDYRANTNLEQISDWLTKILVGVGLTQIAEIKQGLNALTLAAAQGFGEQPHAHVFTGALLAYFTVLGFLFGYLWTRLFMAGALRMADQAAIGELVQEVQRVTEKAETTERKLDAFQQQATHDVDALLLMNRHLNPSPDIPDVTQEALDQAVKAASRPVRVQIFNQAWQVRGDNWRSPATKPKMERTIALFRALIHSEDEKRYHTNHGQLGFALKDKLLPDWLEAEQELSLAIDLRGPWQQHGWLFYELNRALCRIMLDPDFAQDKASEPALRQAILADLQAAAQAADLKTILKTDPVIRKWREFNKISDKNLR